MKSWYWTVGEKAFTWLSHGSFPSLPEEEAEQKPATRSASVFPVDASLAFLPHWDATKPTKKKTRALPDARRIFALALSLTFSQAQIFVDFVLCNCMLCYCLKREEAQELNKSLFLVCLTLFRKSICRFFCIHRNDGLLCPWCLLQTYAFSQPIISFPENLLWWTAEKDFWHKKLELKRMKMNACTLGACGLDTVSKVHSTWSDSDPQNVGDNFEVVYKKPYQHGHYKSMYVPTRASIQGVSMQMYIFIHAADFVGHDILTLLGCSYFCRILHWILNGSNVSKT